MITTRLTSIAVATGAMLSAMAGQAVAVGIVADGGTATSVAVGANGRQTVTHAPAVGGVSNNTYLSVNVSKPGADLNYKRVNVNTIVNQVTGTNPSLIQGGITVLGPRANVILANPNGVTIDGGSFVTNSHVVISTDQVSFNDLTVAPGVTQRNVALTTNGGAITIGPGGLSGTLVNLDLIAKELAVNGPVTNSYLNSNPGARATVGDSTNSYDTSFSPDDNGHDSLVKSTSPGSTGSGFAVDTTALGGITGGRAQIIATDVWSGFTADGLLSLTDERVINGGSFGGGTEATAAGGIKTVSAPSTTPVQISQYLGLTTWGWR